VGITKTSTKKILKTNLIVMSLDILEQHKEKIMALSTYSELKSSIANWLNRSDLH
jgi:hypothetical protein